MSDEHHDDDGRASGSWLTLREAADALGVHYMTMYRYVRNGRLPAHKVDAEWRVDPADLDALDRQDGPAPTRSLRRDTARRRLEDRLVAGDEAGAWMVVETSLTSGADPEDIYVELLIPAMRSVGERWAAGEIPIAAEHRATNVAHRLVGRLGPRFARRGRKRGTIVLGTVEDDHHLLPTAILADLLRSARFEVLDLGAHTPAESFVDTARTADRLVAVGLSASAPGNQRRVRRTIAALREAELGVPLVVGGGGVAGEDEARRLGADGWAGDARSAVALFESLADPANQLAG